MQARFIAWLLTCLGLLIAGIFGFAESARANPLPPGLGWVHDLPADFADQAPLVAVGSLLVVASNEGTVYALRQDDGALAWKTRLGTTPHALDVCGKLIVATGQGTSHAWTLDGVSGQVLWKSPAPLRSAGVQRGQLWELRSDTLTAYEPRTGRRTLSVGGLKEARRFDVVGSRAIIGTKDGVGAWDLVSGRPLWFETLSEARFLTIQGVVVLATARTRARPATLLACDAATGRHLWTRTVRNSDLDSVGDLLLLNERGRTHALIPRTGQPAWTAPDTLYGATLVGPSLGVFTVGNQHEFRDLRTGRVRGRFPAQLRASGPSDGIVAAVDQRGNVWRWRLGETPRLLIHQAIPPSYDTALLPVAAGPRIFLARGGSVACLGPGPGTWHRGGVPRVEVSSRAPLQVPPRIAVEVSARHTREILLEAFALPASVGPEPDLKRLVLGPVLAVRRIPVVAGHAQTSQSQVIRLPRPGAYVVQATAGAVRSRTLVSASNLGVVAKVSPHELLVSATDLQTRRPQGGVQVALYREKLLVARGTTDAAGLVTLPPAPPGGSVQIVASRGSDRLTLDSTPSGPADRRPVYLHTDRPIYRPGHEVFFRGIAMRQESDGGLHVAPATPIQVEIRDSSDNPLLRQAFPTDAHGSFSGSLRLAAEPPLGRYQVKATHAGQTSTLAFEVQEYRKPPFQVEIRPDPALVVTGQPLAFTVAATYYFGGPVGGAKIKVRLERQPLHAEPSPPEDAETESGTSRWYRSFVSEGTVTAGADGKARIEVPTALDKSESGDALFILGAEVTGEEGRVVNGEGTATVTRGTFGVYVEPLSWVARVGEATSLRLHTVDRQGKAHPARVRLRMATWEYRPRTRGSYKVRAEMTATTDANGQAHARWTPRAPGYYQVQAEIRDEGGRVVTHECHVWVAGKGDYAYEYPALQVIPQRRTARPGQTLRCMVMSDRPGPLLLTVEGPRIFEKRMVQMKQSTEIVEIPIRPEYVPTVYVTATLPHKDRVATETVAIRVPDTAHRMDVAIEPDREDYRPGQSASIVLRTSQRGRGISASVALGVVDEAIYALRPDNAVPIHRFFYGHRNNQVQTFDVMPRPVVAGFQTVDTPQEVRKDFKDTAFWQANILTGEDGTARVIVPLPDNLTRWRATARGVALSAEVGEGRAFLVTRKPLMVSAIAPRFLVQGDQSDLLAVVHNRAGRPLQVKTSLAPSAGSLKEPGSGSLDLAPDASGRFRTRLLAGEPGPLSITATANAGGEADAERISLPVLPFGLKSEQMRSALCNGSTSFDFEVPPGAITPRLEVRVSGSAAGVVAGSLDYLAAYPYGCVEQTMSRFLPTLVAVQAMERLGLRDEQRKEAIAPMVAQSLQKLYGYQHSDGGWGWWTSDNTHPFLTGYVIAGLTRAREAGYTVSEDVVKRGLGAAEALLKETQDLDTRVYLAWALTMAGRPPRETLLELNGTSAKMGLYSRALLALALRKAGADPAALVKDAGTEATAQAKELRAQATALVKGLRAEAKTAPGGVFWDARALTAYSWHDDNMECTCLVLQALLQENPADPLIARGISWVLTQRRGNAWKSTRDTAQAVFVLSEFLATTGATRNQGAATVTWDGASLGTADLGMSLREKVFTVEAGRLGAGRHRLEVRAPSGAATIVSAHLAWVQPPRGPYIQATDHGLRVLREYRVGGRISPSAGFTADAGTLVDVTLTIQAPRAMQYVMVEDPRPAGTEPVPASREWYGYQREDRDQHSAFFLTWLPAGVTKLQYQVRTETPGMFRVLPARTSLMYQPDVWGCSDSGVVTIQRVAPKP